MGNGDTALARMSVSRTDARPSPGVDPHDSLVDTAARHIRAILEHTVSKATEEIGAYILKQFYDDDVSLYHSSSPKKGVSLQRLLARCGSLDLPVTRTFLTNSIRLALRSRALPSGATFHSLPESHRIELLGIDDPQVVEALAETVVERKLPVKNLRELIARASVVKAGRRGRKVTPSVLRGLQGALRALTGPDGEPAFGRDHIVALGGHQNREALALIKKLSARVDALAKLLK